MVIQLVAVTVRAEQRERWLEVIAANAQSTRVEKGCDGYWVAEDLEQPNRFVIVEHWASMDAQHAHFRKPEFQAMLSDLEEVLAGPPDVSINEVAATYSLDEALAAAGAG